MILLSHDSTRRLARVAGALGLALASAGLGIASEGCLLINQDHCALNQGSCPEGLVCDECAASNNGCVAEPQAGCAFNETDAGTTTPATTDGTTQGETTQGPATTEDQPTDPTTETTTETTTDTPTDTTGVPSCDPESPKDGCSEPGAPYCVATDQCGLCSELESKSCSDIDSATPACDADSGLCVECTASDVDACSNPNEASCNPYTLECAPCFEHSQCASMACNVESGMCFPAQEGKIIWVQNRENCLVEDGSEESPYCSLADAFSQKALPQQPITFKVLDGGEAYPQSDPLSIVGDYIVAIVNGEPDGEPMPRFRTTDDGTSALLVQEGAVVFIDGLRFDGNPQAIAQPMIVVTAGMSVSRLYIDRSELANNSSLAWVNGGELHVRRTTIHDNEEGMLVTGGSLVIENSFFAHNGTPNATEGMPPGSNKYAPLQVNGNGVVTVTYTTFVANASLFASVLDCSGVVNLGSSRIRNSVLIGKTPLEYGLNMGCGSVIDPETNLQIAYPQMLSQIELDDVFAGEPVDGVYRALDGGELMGLATRNMDDPFMDYDGDARPLDNDAADYAGADLP